MKQKKERAEVMNHREESACSEPYVIVGPSQQIVIYFAVILKPKFLKTSGKPLMKHENNKIF